MSKLKLDAQLPAIRVTKSEKQALNDLANLDGRSLSNYVRMQLINLINVGYRPTEVVNIEPIVEQVEPVIVDTTVPVTPTSVTNEAYQPKVPNTPENENANATAQWSVNNNTKSEPSY